MSELLFAHLEAVVDKDTFLAFVNALAQDRRAAESLSPNVDGHQGAYSGDRDR